METPLGELVTGLFSMEVLGIKFQTHKVMLETPISLM